MNRESNTGNHNNQSKAVGGIAPFGYRWQNGKLVIDETESPTRKLIFELFLKHRRKKTVAKLLNDLGYKTRNGSLFSDTTIDRLLRDTTAKGIRIEQGQETEVEAIVSKEVWERARHLLGEKQTKQPINLFTGFIFCDCGNKMTIPSSSDKYVCLNCKRKIEAKDVEEIVLLQLGQLQIGEIESQNNNQSETICLNAISDNWKYLTTKEKRLVVEQLLGKITIGATEVEIEFAWSANSHKMPSFEQHNSKDNETLNQQSKEENQPIPNEPLLNETEAAKYLGISKMTLLRKRKTREIGCYRVGFRVLYSKEKHLLPFLKQCEK